MDRTACAEPQCLYSIAIPLLPLWTVRPVQSLSACTVELYLYSPYGPYGLCRASVPVQYSYTSTPPMDRTACAEPQCLYKGALYLHLLFERTASHSMTQLSLLHVTTFIFHTSHVTPYSQNICSSTGRQIHLVYQNKFHIQYCRACSNFTTRNLKSHNCCNLNTFRTIRALRHIRGRVK